MVLRAVADVRRKYADLLIDLDILKIEDVIDNLLLGRGEVAAMAVVQMLKIGMPKVLGRLTIMRELAVFQTSAPFCL